MPQVHLLQMLHLLFSFPFGVAKVNLWDSSSTEQCLSLRQIPEDASRDVCLAPGVADPSSGISGTHLGRKLTHGNSEKNAIQELA